MGKSSGLDEVRVVYSGAFGEIRIIKCSQIAKSLEFKTEKRVYERRSLGGNKVR